VQCHAAAGVYGLPRQGSRQPRVRSASCGLKGGNDGYRYGVWAGECAGSWSPQRWQAADCQGRPERVGGRQAVSEASLPLTVSRLPPTHHARASTLTRPDSMT
jgi:hypothetical protein